VWCDCAPPLVNRKSLVSKWGDDLDLKIGILHIFDPSPVCKGTHRNQLSFLSFTLSLVRSLSLALAHALSFPRSCVTRRRLLRTLSHVTQQLALSKSANPGPLRHRQEKQAHRKKLNPEKRLSSSKLGIPLALSRKSVYPRGPYLVGIVLKWSGFLHGPLVYPGQLRHRQEKRAYTKKRETPRQTSAHLLHASSSSSFPPH